MRRSLIVAMLALLAATGVGAQRGGYRGNYFSGDPNEYYSPPDFADVADGFTTTCFTAETACESVFAA